MSILELIGVIIAALSLYLQAKERKKEKYKAPISPPRGHGGRND